MHQGLAWCARLSPCRGREVPSSTFDVFFKKWNTSQVKRIPPVVNWRETLQSAARPEPWTRLRLLTLGHRRTTSAISLGWRRGTKASIGRWWLAGVRAATLEVVVTGSTRNNTNSNRGRTTVRERCCRQQLSSHSGCASTPTTVPYMFMVHGSSCAHINSDYHLSLNMHLSQTVFFLSHSSHIARTLLPPGIDQAAGSTAPASNSTASVHAGCPAATG